MYAPEARVLYTRQSHLRISGAATLWQRFKAVKNYFAKGVASSRALRFGAWERRDSSTIRSDYRHSVNYLIWVIIYLTNHPVKRMMGRQKIVHLTTHGSTSAPMRLTTLREVLLPWY